jgi:hypothetical protein
LSLSLPHSFPPSLPSSSHIYRSPSSSIDLSVIKSVDPFSIFGYLSCYKLLSQSYNILNRKDKRNGIEKGRNGEEMKGSGGKAGEVNIGQKKRNDKTGME